MSDRATLLRDEIVRLLEEQAAPAREAGDGVLPSVEALDEDGVVKAIVIDDDANCYRITIEEV